MNYKPLIVVVDDNPRILENFHDVSTSQNVSIVGFESWDMARQFLESKESVDGLILDAKGKLTAERQESEAHLQQALNWISKQEGKNIVIPYAVYSAYYDDLETFSEEKKAGKIFSKKQLNSEILVLEYLKKEIAQTPKLKIINQYPEPFQCFGGRYLDKKYETFLVNIVSIFEDKNLHDPDNLLFNPCRILLESVFRKITETDEKVLPYLLLNFENQRVGLINCSKHLNGVPVTINGQIIPCRKFLDEYISQQIQTIIGVCHPASHDIQLRYSKYTFQSVLWAVFDVLIWLKTFIDQRQ